KLRHGTVAGDDDVSRTGSEQLIEPGPLVEVIADDVIVRGVVVKRVGQHRDVRREGRSDAAVGAVEALYPRRGSGWRRVAKDLALTVPCLEQRPAAAAARDRARQRGEQRPNVLPLSSDV